MHYFRYRIKKIGHLSDSKLLQCPAQVTDLKTIKNEFSRKHNKTNLGLSSAAYGFSFDLKPY
jgi:hypothetical protein